MYGDSKRAQRLYQQDSDAEEEEDLQPNPKLAGGKKKLIIVLILNLITLGNSLPRRYGAFPPELANMPLGMNQFKYSFEKFSVFQWILTPTMLTKGPLWC